MKVIRILSVVFATIALALSIVCLTDVLDIKVGLPIALGLLATVSGLNAYLCHKEGRKKEMIFLIVIAVILLVVGISYIFVK